MNRNYLKGRLGDRINAVFAVLPVIISACSCDGSQSFLRIIIRASVETVPAQTIA